MLPKLLSHLTRFESILAGASILLLAFLLLLDVGAREIWGESLPWANKLALHLMILSGCIGVSLASSHGQQLRSEMGEVIFKGKSKDYMIVVRELSVSLFCAFFAYLSWKYIAQSREFGDLHVVTQVPLWLIQCPFFFVFAILTCKHLIFALRKDLRPQPQGRH